MSKLEEIKKQFQYDKKVVKEFKTGTTNYDVLNYIYRLECEIHYLDAKNKNSEQALNEIKDKLLCYGEIFDSEILQQFQKECLETIDKVGGNDERS